MTVPSYEVGRLAALTVRLVLASGLSRDEARAALGLASAMIDDESHGAEASAHFPPRSVQRPSTTPARRI